MIIVCAVEDVEKRLAQGDIAAVLSIEHPGAQDGAGAAPRLTGVAQEILVFWDTEDDKAVDGPSAAVVTAAFDFLSQHDSENVIIHCRAGRSRSVGLALAWLAFQNGVEPAIEEIKRIRPIAAPNLGIIRIADELLNFGGRLVDAVLKDSLFTQNRQKSEEKRKAYAEKYPEILKKLYPEVK